MSKSDNQKTSKDVSKLDAATSIISDLTVQREAVRKQAEELFDGITLGMYVCDPDGDSFTPVRWEESPLRENYIAAIMRIVAQAQIEVLERLSQDKADNHVTPMYGVTNRQIHEMVDELQHLQQGKKEENKI